MPPEKPEPPKEPVVDDKQTEEDAIRAWRVLQASALGFEWCDAVELADSGADLHELADLLERGCPPGLAARIV